MRRAFVFLGMTLAAYGQRQMSVPDLVTFIKSSIQLRNDDRAVASTVRRLKLTTRLDPGTVEDLQGLGAGLHGLPLVQELAVAGAFQESDARFHRVAGKRVEAEDQRTAHQAVDQGPMGIRIDVGNAAVAALEVQAVGRDHAVEQVERRARRAGAGGAGGGRENTRGLAFMVRWLAVGRESRARGSHIRLDREWIGLRCPAGECDAAGQKEAAVDEPVAGGLFGRGFLLPQSAHVILP